MYKGLPAEEELYRSLVNVGLKAGMKMVIAKVHAALFMEPGPMSLEELAEKTGYSLASVSNAVKHLEFHMQVKRIKEPGTKKVYVQGDKNMIHSIRQQFNHAIDTLIKPMQDIMPGIIEDLEKAQKDPKTGKGKREELKGKLAWYNDYLEQNREIEELFTSTEKAFKKLEQSHR